MKKYLFPALAVIGFVLLLGVAGASDCGTLTTGQAAARGIIGLLLFGAGTLNMRAKEKAAAITSSNRKAHGKTSCQSQTDYNTISVKAQYERRA